MLHKVNHQRDINDGCLYSHSPTSSTTSSTFLSSRAFPHHWSADIYCIAPLSFTNSSDSAADKTFCLSTTLSTGSSTLDLQTQEQLANRYHSRARRTLTLNTSVRRNSLEESTSNTRSITPHGQPENQSESTSGSGSRENDRDSSTSASTSGSSVGGANVDQSVGGAELPFERFDPDPTRPKFDWNGDPFEPMQPKLPPHDFDHDAFETYPTIIKKAKYTYTTLRKRSMPSPGIRRKSPSLGVGRKKSSFSPGYQAVEMRYRDQMREKSMSKFVVDGKQPRYRDPTKHRDPGSPKSIHLIISSVEPSSDGRTGPSRGPSSSLEEGETMITSAQSIEGWTSYAPSSSGVRSRSRRHKFDDHSDYPQSNCSYRTRTPDPQDISYYDIAETQSCRPCVIL